MGYERQTAILVTAQYEDHGRHWIKIAHDKAVEIFHTPVDVLHDHIAYVSDPTPAVVNSVRSFAVFPNGSKLGWGLADAHDVARKRFVAWLREQAYGDDASPLDWVEVQYGDDEKKTKVIADSDDLYRSCNGCQNCKATT